VEYDLNHMTWEDVSAAVEANRVVLQPLGAIEQHGRHLPVDTDNLIAESLCRAAGAGFPDEFVVAPIIPYGFNDHNMEFPGTVSIRPETLLSYLFDVGHSFATAGFRRIVWVNGHGSNGTLLIRAGPRGRSRAARDAGVSSRRCRSRLRAGDLPLYALGAGASARGAHRRRASGGLP